MSGPTTLTINKPFDEALAHVKATFMKHKFGVLFEINTGSLLMEKIQKDVGLHTVIGVCNPGVAAGVFDNSMPHTAYLPCHVAVMSKEGESTSTVAFVNPAAFFAGEDGLQPTVDKIKEVLTAVTADL